MSTKKITKTVENYEYICDFCGWRASAKCEGCRKDICYTCCEVDPDDTGCDYPRRWCKKCFKIGEPFMKKIYELEEEQDAQQAAWREKCREEANNGR
jgi:hypothetical protein